MESKRARSGCLAAVITVAVVLALGIAALVAVVVVGVSMQGGMSGAGRPWARAQKGVDEFPGCQRVWSYGAGDIQVVRIQLSGVIMRSEGEGLFGTPVDPVAAVLEAIQDAKQDPAISGIILEIDSPGGEITASDIIYRALLDFKEAQPGRVVVALFGDVAASGAYYVAMAADHVIAHPTTLTGSIGVLISALNMKALGDKIGIQDVTIKSGENKDMLNPLREISDEERAILQNVVDELYGRFVELIVQARELPAERVRAMADGRVFTAGQAMELGLIDEIGYWEDAVARTAALLDADEVKVFRYEPRRLSLIAMLRGQSASARVIGELMRWPRVRIMYLWQP